jgi:hypothetical protein
VTPELLAAFETLKRSRVDTSNEENVHSAIAKLLSTASIPFEHEARLTSRERIDFLIGRVGVEVKIDGSRAALERQLRRYAAHPGVDELVVVSSKTQLSGVPRSIDGKPVTTFVLWGSLW